MFLDYVALQTLTWDPVRRVYGDRRNTGLQLFSHVSWHGRDRANESFRERRVVRSSQQLTLCGCRSSILPNGLCIVRLKFFAFTTLIACEKCLVGHHLRLG